ncbi:hypothetical protein EDC61_1078 [Sulfuritortus calidifontis]|uniref:Uncharacterized protein n=1 Tax=Sulfuritortus calidifontis TaxID=1914471 RepID=A0A4R3JV71_9PROT|nr:hypothetical protein [Sulfuritortus calidifontis]TCS71870.1 hypothetical protein EDC61_1078 [Sulfuritortus calidifontis]
MNTPLEIQKRREIVFAPFPTGQIALALQVLEGLPGLSAQQIDHQTVEIEYPVTDYTLEGLLTGLEAQGFHLHYTLYIRLKHALVFYCERTQLENLIRPTTPTKRYQPHVDAWQKRPHGDHDATPTEWRQYK